MASVGWIGVCNVEMTRILANVIVQPETITKVPCETTFIGELPPGSNGLAGRVYLLNRVTFAVLGFSYDGQAEGWYMYCSYKINRQSLLILYNICKDTMPFLMKYPNVEMHLHQFYYMYTPHTSDAFFWVGDGESPSISGYGCTYNQDM